jgi:MIP family channel proteins
VRSIGEEIVAEVIGTFALIFIGAGAVVILSGGGAAGLVGIALAHGLVLAVFVSNLGHISGAHFNPAVTVGAWVAGKIETTRAGIYILAQLAGAALGAAVLRWALPLAVWKDAFLGTPTVNHAQGITSAKAVLLEAVLTFFLVMTVFATAIDERGTFKAIAGLPIGFVLTFDILVAGPLTGAAMNPARTFGPALLSGHWTDFWVYVAGPAIGSIVAATVYQFSFLRTRAVVSAPVTDTPIGGGPDGQDVKDES